MENRIDTLWAMAEEWLTTDEAAAYLKTEPRSLLRWVREGRVPAYRLSGTKRHVYRFLARDLDATLTGRQVAGTGAGQAVLQ
jgi:excisionase family DNA binding protein